MQKFYEYEKQHFKATDLVNTSSKNSHINGGSKRGADVRPP